MNLQIQRATQHGFVPPPTAGSLQELERLLAASPNLDPNTEQGALQKAAWASAIGSELEELHSELTAQYRHSETSEADFLEDFPEHSAHVEELRLESKAIVRAVRDILDRLWWADWPDAGSQFETTVRNTIERIKSHDRAENELLQCAYTLDLGIAG